MISSTAYRLFDLNYNVFVISNNTIESTSDLPGVSSALAIDTAVKQGMIPKLPANVITVEQAIAALERSGPAIF